MAHFNRERVPERVVHAKGGGAYGVLEITEDVSQFTRPSCSRRAPGPTPSSGSAPSRASSAAPTPCRDPRGFAMKFYTEDGNYDLVGNNTPVFFIRDPQKFSDFIHSQKRRAGQPPARPQHAVGLLDAAPESAHQVSFLMSDRGTPRFWRHMNGYGSHTFIVVQRRGREVLGQVPLQDRPGRQELHRRRGRQRPGPRLPHPRPLEAIKRGDHPSWRSRSRSCRSRTRRTTASTRST